VQPADMATRLTFSRQRNIPKDETRSMFFDGFSGPSLGYFLSDHFAFVFWSFHIPAKKDSCFAGLIFPPLFYP